MDKKVFHCNVELAVNLIKGKWIPLIIFYIGDFGIMRYGELRRRIPNMNERVLSRQLRELEERHIISRKVYDELPPKVEYQLTDMGEALLPILKGLGSWGKTYNATYDYGEIDVKHECES